MVPMVNTAEEAKYVVQCAKFPPIGIRGQGSPFASWTNSLSVPEYVKSANANLLTIVQIETVQAVKNVDSIVNVEGVGEFTSSPCPR
jgi:4-hydroxy-2-oxoheptanedioate aldolase